MCDFKKGFKLCTCAETALKQEEIGWLLQRKNEKLPIQHRRGRAAAPRFSSEELSVKEYILLQLQHRNCFDFDYTPQEDDSLKIKMEEGNSSWAAFRFQGGYWMNDNSDSLSSWKTQLEHYKNGCCEQDINSIVTPNNISNNQVKACSVSKILDEMKKKIEAEEKKAAKENELGDLL